MSNTLIFFLSPLTAIDVLEVLTEVDEKSRRSPEIIQYFIVSHRKWTQKRSSAVSQCETRQSPPCVSVGRMICRGSWLRLRSCVGTWPSVSPYAAFRIIHGRFKAFQDKPLKGKHADSKRKCVAITERRKKANSHEKICWSLSVIVL